MILWYTVVLVLQISAPNGFKYCAGCELLTHFSSEGLQTAISSNAKH